MLPPPRLPPPTDSAVLFSIWFLEHRRKDFVEMNVHHLAAIFVTLISYQFDFTRVGAMVKVCGSI